MSYLQRLFDWKTLIALEGRREEFIPDGAQFVLLHDTSFFKPQYDIWDIKPAGAIVTLLGDYKSSCPCFWINKDWSHLFLYQVIPLEIYEDKHYAKARITI